MRQINQNQFPDWWEAWHGLTNVTLQSDADNDGVTDLYECWADTLPKDPASKFEVKLLPATPSDPPCLIWTTAANRIYAVECSTNLFDGYFVLKENLWNNPGPYYLSQDETNQSARFYRVSIQY